MRSPPTSVLPIASLLLLSAAACSSNGGTGDTDAGADVPVSVDAGTATDTPVAPTDTPVVQVDVPIVNLDAPLPVDVPTRTDTPVVPTDVPAGSCGVSAGVATFLAEAATSNWAAQNRSRTMMMFGCADATSAAGCLSSYPLADATTIGDNRGAVTGAHLRVLYSSTTRSGYWTRSSADGRFIGRGTRIWDLSRSAEITVTGAEYDPAFFPDNSGFMYHPGGRMCPMSAITTGTPTSIAASGAGSPCAGGSIGLYEHLAAALGGEDYWASSAGSAAWDDGGHNPTLQETPQNDPWTDSATTTLSLMANTGSGFRYVASRNLRTPLQGDGVISPSSRALITRFVDNDGVYRGYVLHRLNATHTGSAVTASLTELARYCVQGAKPAFSYDERFIIYHHYIGGGDTADADAMELGFTGASDEGFAQYASRGAANIYLLNLATGQTTRLTNMAPGQYALYPHFRSDGWIYFLVRTLGTSREHVIASDAALPR